MRLAGDGMEKELVPAGIFEAQIDDHHVEPLSAEESFSFISGARGSDVVTIFHQSAFERPADGWFIVNYKNARLLQKQSNLSFQGPPSHRERWSSQGWESFPMPGYSAFASFATNTSRGMLRLILCGVVLKKIRT